MKTRWMGTWMALGAALVLSGCSENTSTGSGQAAPETSDAARAVADGATKAMEAMKASVPDVTKAVETAAKSATESTTQAVNALMAEVQKLVAEGKGSEAMQKIQSALAGFKLTPEQQKMVDDALKKAQAALSQAGADATKAAESVVPKLPQ